MLPQILNVYDWAKNHMFVPAISASMNAGRYIGPGDMGDYGSSRSDGTVERTELSDIIHHLMDLTTPQIRKNEALLCPPYCFSLYLMSDIVARKLCQGDVETPNETVHAQRFLHSFNGRVGFDGLLNRYQFFKYMVRQLLIDRYVVALVKRKNNGWRLMWEQRGDVTLQRSKEDKFFYEFKDGGMVAPEGVFHIQLFWDYDIYQNETMSTTRFFPRPSYDELAEEILTFNFLRAYVRKYLTAPGSMKMGGYQQVDVSQIGVDRDKNAENFVDSFVAHLPIITPASDRAEARGYDGLMGYDSVSKIMQDTAFRIYRTMGLSNFMTAEDRTSERGSGVKHMAMPDGRRGAVKSSP